jgi:hypothetical protein
MWSKLAIRRSSAATSSARLWCRKSKHEVAGGVHFIRVLKFIMDMFYIRHTVKGNMKVSRHSYLLLAYLPSSFYFLKQRFWNWTPASFTGKGLIQTICRETGNSSMDWDELNRLLTWGTEHSLVSGSLHEIKENRNLYGIWGVKSCEIRWKTIQVSEGRIATIFRIE